MYLENWKIAISSRIGCFNTPLSPWLSHIFSFLTYKGDNPLIPVLTKHLRHRHPFSAFWREDRGSHTLNNSFSMGQERWSWKQNQGLCNTNHTFFHYAMVFNKRAYYVTCLAEKGKKNPYFPNTKSISCLRKSICNVFWFSCLLNHFSRFTQSFKHCISAVQILGNTRASESPVIPSLIVHLNI